MRPSLLARRDRHSPVGIGAALIGGLAIIGLSVGCQLLLPSGDDDGRTTSTGMGGAEASSSGSGTTGKTSSAKTSSSDATATAASNSSTDAASSSTGLTCEQGQGCLTTPPTFDKCEMSDVCQSLGAGDWCNDYCTSVIQKCGATAAQYASATQCCSACQYLRAHPAIAPSNNVCCRANTLNDDALLDPSDCTKAGPMGAAKNDNAMAECGSQSLHVCTLFEKICANKIADVACITGHSCSANFGTAMSEVYGPTAQGPMSTVLQHVMEAALGGDVDAECESAAMLACGTVVTPTGPGGGP